MNVLLRDLRYALRTLARSPAFTLVAVATLALGIGANTAIFSVVHALLLRPLPYGHSDRLGMVWLDNRRLGLHEDLMSYPIFEDWKKNQAFEAMSAFTLSSATLTGGEEPERIPTAPVAADFFSTLGVRPLLGRAFTVEEDQPGRDRVAVLSHGLWVRRLGADPAAIGRTIELDGRSVTVIGVMPADFRFPEKTTELWTPLALDNRIRNARYAFWMRVVGRIKPGVTWDQARAEMARVGAALERQYSEMAGYGAWVVPLRTQLVGNVRLPLLVLTGAVAIVLLITCANVANLLLARAATREREIAVRVAVGAGRARLVRQLLTESVLLATVAGGLGLLFAHWGVTALAAAAPQDMPGLDQVRTDATVLAFTLLVSLATGVLFGLAPAVHATTGDLAEALKEGGRAHTGGIAGRHLRHALVVGEIALAVVLLAGAALLIRSFVHLRGVDPGFHAERVLTMQMVVSRSKYPEGPQVAAFYRQLLERVARIPGVSAAGAVSTLLLGVTPNSASFTIEGRPPVPEAEQIEATIDTVSPGFFSAMGVPLLKGRFFTDADGPDSKRVVLINETMARRFWPDEDPVGRRFTFGRARPDSRWLTIAGVVGDMKRQGLDRLARSETFLPHAQSPRRGMLLLFRTSTDPAALAATIRREIRALDRDQPLSAAATLDQVLGQTVAHRRFQMGLLGLFAALALALAAIGIYGVMHYAVVQRTPEFGIRLALGAGASDVLWLVLRQGLGLAVAGLAIGLAGALALTRVMTSLLFGVRPGDPATLAGVAVVLIAVALGACYLPSRQASRVNPITALRWE